MISRKLSKIIESEYLRPNKKTKYFSVKLDSGKKSIVAVNNFNKSSKTISGIMVGKDGMPKEKRVKGGFSRNVIVFNKSDIKDELVMNLKYGELQRK